MDKKKVILDSRTEKYLDKLATPESKAKFRGFLKELRDKGFIPFVWSSTRTYSEAKKIWDSNPKVRETVRCIGCDYHFFGYAVDVTFTKDGKTYNENTSKQDYIDSGIPEIAAKHGLIWGGDFANYYDPSHFDYRRHSLHTLEKIAYKKYKSLAKTNIYRLW